MSILRSFSAILGSGVRVASESVPSLLSYRVDSLCCILSARVPKGQVRGAVASCSVVAARADQLSHLRNSPEEPILQQLHFVRREKIAHSHNRVHCIKLRLSKARKAAFDDRDASTGRFDLRHDCDASESHAQSIRD